MTPETALILALAATPYPARPPAPAEPPPAQVFYGTELSAPFLPVLPPAASWSIPDDMRDALTAAPAPGAAAGWLKAPASLLLLNADGSLVHELGIGQSSEQDGALRRRMLAGASEDGRFAWHWQRVERRTAGRVERAPQTDRVLVFLGSHGQILFTVPGADAPEGLPPVRLSASGETLLSARREGGAWTVAALSFTGKELGAVTKAHRVESMDLSPDGRRALVAWAGLDQPLMVTVLDLRTQERLDIPAARLPPGPWSLYPDGSLRAAGRPVPTAP